MRQGAWKPLAITALASAAVAALLFAAWRISLGREAEQGPAVTSFRPVFTRDYDASEELAQALERLGTDEKLAGLQGAEPVSQRKIALVFSGLASPAQMEQILMMLEEFDVKAAFFVDGKSAAEDPESVRAIRAGGHVLGNYGLNAETHPERMEEAALLESMVRTQVILREITEDVPQLYQGNGAEYTPQVLHAAHCAGLSGAVRASSFLSASSFPSFSAAMGFVQGLSPGEIVCVKLAGVLDEIEYAPPVEEARPATDPPPGLEEEPPPAPEPDILTVVEYLLQALRTTRTRVTTLERLPLDWDDLLESQFSARSDAAGRQVPESEAVPADYFREALFIGDSLTQSLAGYPFPTGLRDTANICAYRSITPEQILNNVTAENVSGRQVPVLDEIFAAAPRRVYVMLGANCLSTQDDAAILDSYSRLLNLLLERFPGVPVYVEGLLPVTRTVSETQVTMSNGRIQDLSAELAELAGEKGCYFLNPAGALEDEEGNLPFFLAREDGVHLTEEGVRRYTAYLRRHTAE